MSDRPEVHDDMVGRGWYRPVGVPRRYGVRATRTRGPRDGLRIYSPQRKLARLRFAWGRLPVVRSCGLSHRVPPLPLDELVTRLGLNVDGAVAIQGSSPDRWVVGLEAANQLVAVAKIGTPVDDGLRREAAVLGEVRVNDSWVRLPELLLAENVENYFALVTKAAPRRTGRVSLDQVGELTTQLTNGLLGLSCIHGDLAQWNTIRAGDSIWIVDWEHSRRERLPLWDLTDHLFREGVLVNRYTPREVIGHLTMKGSVGWKHLVNVGEDPNRARDLVLVYLNGRPTLGKSATLFEKRMRGCLG